MKYIIFICSFSLLFLCQSCLKKRHFQTFEGGEIIQVQFEPGIFPPLDSFITNIKIVPLETTDDCLIGQHIVSVKLYNDLIYINSDTKHLLVFDLNGNFIREIGSRGQGPGELLSIRDFIFTKEGMIEILDFMKIERYTFEGQHVSTNRLFDSLNKEAQYNPMNFTKSLSGRYYLWGGLGLSDEKIRNKSYLMHRVNSNIQLEKSYFDPKYGDGGVMDRFKYYNDYILVAPSAFDYNIYQVDSNDSITVRYSFDFGKYGFDSSKDVDITTIDFQNYFRIFDFHETDLFLNFSFPFQNSLHSLLYSKETGQTFIKSHKPDVNEKEFRFFRIQATYNELLIAVIDVSWLKFEVERMSQENIYKWGMERFIELNNNDNPVLVFYTPKQ